MPVGDKAVRAFRSFARLFPDADKLTYFELCDRVRGACRSEREAMKLLAVCDTLRFLESTGREETANAVKEVYLACRGRTPRKNEISYRVLQYAFNSNIDERTVWRRLGEAKSLYLKLEQKAFEKWS